MSELVPTAGQTVGPFFGFALPYDGAPDLVAPDAPGARRLSGRVLDGHGEPVPDALLESGRVTDVVGPAARRDGHATAGAAPRPTPTAATPSPCRSPAAPSSR